jgi:hypothetical protein
MDLLKVFPNVPMMIREPDRVLWTVGHTSFGRLNHPTCWNSHGAYLWLTKPNLERDENGWFNVDGCVSHAAEVECTWLEWLRDAWSHNYGAVILPARRQLPPSDHLSFERIMYDLRGWHKQDVTDSRKTALQWIMRCDFILWAAMHPNESASPPASPGDDGDDSDDEPPPFDDREDED